MDRRSFIRGALFVAASPAIVRVSSLMPVKVYDDLIFVERTFAQTPYFTHEAFLRIVSEEYQVPIRLLKGPIINIPEEEKQADQFIKNFISLYT